MNKFSLTVNYISSTSHLTCKNLFDRFLEKNTRIVRGGGTQMCHWTSLLSWGLSLNP